MDTEDFLAHYGVKGMKWGVRKDKFMRAYRARRAKRIRNKSIEQIGINKKLHTDKLSNDELRSLNERLKLESEFATYVIPKPKQQTPQQAKTQQKGQSYSVKLAQSAGTIAVGATANHLTKQWLNKKFGALPK